jgi:hypothetical protein
MKVKFANTEVEIWKLRAGTVLRWHGEYVHLKGFWFFDDHVDVKANSYNGKTHCYESTSLEWLEPHN